jgi:hypothetical protein
VNIAETTFEQVTVLQGSSGRPIKGAVQKQPANPVKMCVAGTGCLQLKGLCKLLLGPLIATLNPIHLLGFATLQKAISQFILWPTPDFLWPL